MNALERRIPPPVVAILVAVTMWLVSKVSSAVEIDRILRLRLAGAFAFAAALLAVLGFMALRRARTTIDPIRVDRTSALVTNGIYRTSRNPMYLGLVFLLCGWAFYLSTPWAAVGLLVFVAFITRFQIVPEERALLSRFGDAYAVYRRRVRRWI